MTHEATPGGIQKQAGRPFPWRCPNCLQDAVEPQRIAYTCEASHDGRRYHLEIPAIDIPKCQKCGTLVMSNRVDDQIVHALRAQIHLLTPEQIRGAREALGLKSKELAERLGIAAETISRWERGGLVQSRAMDNLLRVFFAVPQARAVLRGAQQDPLLGVEVVFGSNDPTCQLERAIPVGQG